MFSNPHDETGAQMNGPDATPQNLDEISILDALVAVARNRRLVLIAASIGIFVGLLVAVFSSNQYSASVKVIPDLEKSASSSLSNLGILRGLGMNLGSGEGWITTQAYPDILRSREIQIAVARDSYYFPVLDETMSIVDYVGRPKGTFGVIMRYTFGLPGLLFRAMRASPVNANSDGGYLTEDEIAAIEYVNDALSVDMARETGIITLSARSIDPQVSVDLVNNYLKHLTERIWAIYSKKAQDNLDFIRDRFNKAEKELLAAEEELATFSDRNQNPQTARLRTGRERLQRQVTFKVQLYSNLQAQFTQAELDLQKAKPVLTVIEAATPSNKRSGPKRKLMVILSLFAGICVGILLIAVKYSLEKSRQDPDSKSKIEEIIAAVLPAKLIRRMGA